MSVKLYRNNKHNIRSMAGTPTLTNTTHFSELSFDNYSFTGDQVNQPALDLSDTAFRPNRPTHTTASSYEDSNFSEANTNHSPSDSGVGSNLSFYVYEKTELAQQTAEMAKELRTLCMLTNDFKNDVQLTRASYADLLQEMEGKIRPYLVRLDETMKGQEFLMRKNLDNCKLTDDRVTWLLHYNKLLTEFRFMLQNLTIQVFDELENILRLQTRGCCNISVKPTTEQILFETIDQLTTIQSELNH